MEIERLNYIEEKNRQQELSVEDVHAVIDALRAERERCAKAAENWLEVYGAANPIHISARQWASDAVRDIADAIRNPQT